MLSGALLLHSSLADDPLAFYRRRLSRILPPLIAWTVIYLVRGSVTLDQAVSYVLAGRPSFHLYFLYLLVGLYLVAPFLRPLVARTDRRVLGIGIVVFLALGMSDDLIVVWRHLGGVNAATRFVPYIGYFLAGAWLIGLRPTRARVITAATVAVVAILGTAIGTKVLVHFFGLGQGRYLYEYLSVTTVPASLAVFALFLWSAPWADRLATRLPRGWLSVVAGSTLGIYVIHPLFLSWLGDFGLGPRTFFVPLAVAATVLATFALSLATILILRKVPGIRRLV